MKNKFKTFVLAAFAVFAFVAHSQSASADEWRYDRYGHRYYDRHTVVVHRDYYSRPVRYYGPDAYYEPYGTYVAPAPVYVAPRPVIYQPAPVAAINVRL